VLVRLGPGAVRPARAGGLTIAADFPVWLASSFAQRALHQGCAVVIPSHGRWGRLAIVWRQRAEGTVL